MTNHAARLYVVACSLLVFFLVWAVLAAHPWQGSASVRDPRLVALAKREQRLRSEAKLVQQIVDRRYAAYKSSLASRRAQLAAAKSAASAAQAPAPSVRIVTLPPLTITRTS